MYRYLSLWFASELHAFLPILEKKIIRKTPANVLRAKSHVSHTILWFILYFKVLVPEKMEYFIYNNKIESQSLNE